MPTPKESLARSLHEAADHLVGRGHSDEALLEACDAVTGANEILRNGEELSKEHRLLVFLSEMVGVLGARIPEDGEILSLIHI